MSRSTIYPQIPLSLLLIILSISSSLFSQQVVNSQPPLNHQQQEEQRILLKLKNDWGNPPSLNYPLLFYNPDNPSSMNNNSWNPSTFPNHCNWTGIICDHVDGFVTGIQLNRMNITKKIPPIICDLKNLIQIDLGGNVIPGEFPTSLYNCSKLEILELASNNFQGRIPDDIYRLSSLRELNLIFNNFSGDIPASIGRFPLLQNLQLGANRFNGSFPPEIGNLTNLEELDLEFNMFLPSRIPPEFGKLKKLKILWMVQMNLIGEIPETIGNLSNLEILYFSYNNLTGTIPDNLSLLKNLRDVDLSNNNFSRDEIPSNISKSSKLSPELLTVIVVIVGPPFLVSIILILFFIKNVSQRKPKQDLATWDMTSFQKLHFTESNILSNLTDNNQIGSGGSGKVYRVPIDHLGHFVAVKKIWSERKLDKKMEKQFQAEVQILGTIRHNNIVKLLCCISNKDTKLLVYEYMENGSLYQWLHENNRSLSDSNHQRFLINWPKRLQIAVGIAQGLAYMHHNCSPPIIHRDVKSSNILLDSDFKAKIADFGLARILTKQGEPNSASVIAGSFGYIAPEYAHTRKVNEKIDVYSFGVVLLELVTGKKANKGDEIRNLAQWAWFRFQEVDSVDVLMDEGVKEECYLDEMRMVFKLGMICTNTLPSTRPSMKEALHILLMHGPRHPIQGLASSSPEIQIEEE